MKKYDLVVARYHEDVSWLSGLNTENIEIKLYNKGKDDIDFPYTKLENIGGDAQVYIYHIIKNYDNLADFTIFLQGNPFDHYPDIINSIYRHIDKPFQYLTEQVFVTEYITCGWEVNIKSQRPQGAKYPLTRLEPTAREILEDETPLICTFGIGQQFLASRDTIHIRSKEFYQNILDKFETNYLLPWFLERLWPTIFRTEAIK
jgi:hypothetical protein